MDWVGSGLAASLTLTEGNKRALPLRHGQAATVDDWSRGVLGVESSEAAVFGLAVGATMLEKASGGVTAGGGVVVAGVVKGRQCD